MVGASISEDILKVKEKIMEKTVSVPAGSDVRASLPDDGCCFFVGKIGAWSKSRWKRVSAMKT